MVKLSVTLLMMAVLAFPIAIPASRHWRWSDTFRSGTCVAEDVTVDLRSDGTGIQRSVTAAPNGDERRRQWRWQVEGLDARFVRLWRAPEVSGPRLTRGQSSSSYRFDYTFAFPADRFEQTTYLRLWYRC